MPGGDGSGPRGEGPMTGRGLGYCAVKLGSPIVSRIARRFVGAGRGGVRQRARDGTGPGPGRSGRRSNQ